MVVIKYIVPYLGYAVMITGLAHFAQGIAVMRPSGINTVPWLFVISFLLTAIFVWVLFPRGGAWFFLTEAILLIVAKVWL